MRCPSRSIFNAPDQHEAEHLLGEFLDRYAKTATKLVQWVEENLQRIIKIHTSDFEYKGHRRRASDQEPQYEINSDKTDHIAAHKESTIERSRR